eukprot:Phypoly_transcript_00499.p1 GENE.Phypoly_transcript_00499~~Phypoly_transcript_00499.p1  ORF type:complete len:1191 (-),score=146.73 Phypoly_transcript_00499:406-3978(-)
MLRNANTSPHKKLSPTRPMLLHVVLKHVPNCYACLPPFLLKNIIEASNGAFVALEVSWTDHSDHESPRKKIFLGWSGEASTQRDTIEISSHFAVALSLHEGQTVDVQPRINVLDADRIHVEPVSPDDWEILELNQQYLEEQFINQVNVLFEKEVIPLWVHQQTIINLRIVKIEPPIPPGSKTPCVRLSNQTEVVVAPKPRAIPSSAVNAKTQKAAQWRVLRVADLHADPTSVVVHPLDLESFGWTVGGILHVDGAKLNDPKHLSQQMSVFMHVDPLPNPVGGEGDNGSQTHSHTIFSRVFTGLNVPRGHISISRLHRWQSEYHIHERVCVSMPAPHTLPITQFTKVTLRPVIWWGKTKENATSSRAIISEALKFMDTPKLAQAAKNGFLKWINSKAEKDGHPRAPFLHNSVVEITLEELRVSLDVCVDFDTIDENKTNNLYMVGSSGLHIVFAPSEHPSSPEAPVCILPPSSDFADSWNSIINFPSPIANELETIPKNYTQQVAVIRNLSFSFCRSRYYFYERYSFSMLGGMDSLVQSCKEHMLAILLRGIGWKSGLEREGGGEDGTWGSESTPGGKQLGSSTNASVGAVWGGGGGLGGLLVYGPSGSGKTHLLHALARWCSTTTELSPSERPYVCPVSCGTLVSGGDHKKAKNMKQALALAFWWAFVNSPSIILLDDLDELVPAALENDPSSGQYSDGMALYLCSLMQNLMQKPPCHVHCYENNIAVVASCKSLQSLNPLLTGPNLFSLKLDITDSFNKDARLKILNMVLRSRLSAISPSLATLTLERNELNSENSIYRSENGISSDVDLRSVASKLDNYRASDIMSFVDRTLHAASCRTILEANNSLPKNSTQQKRTGVMLSMNDFETARKGFVPVALKGVSLHTSSVSWDSVGGLQTVKSTLIETLEWPMKYPDLYKRLPLRMTSGILLFGPPGCGKTMLANAVAKECGLNFISVKGPELLNKYIGASEQGVRDLFARAASAAPCVVFFDEFESLAPRRGHDSTGVTDRIVNQLLTQLDGVEEIKGSYTLAATSRPDLIDPALLRPGRIDKILYCGMPDESSRLDILHAIARTAELVFESDVSMETLAKKTENYSGADLQALLYNAQLQAVHTRIDKLTNKEGIITEGDNNAPPSVGMHELLAALDETPPSVDAKERNRYAKIHGDFIQSRGDVSLVAQTGPRQTLA